ncbi:MAG TPA: lipocalin-like domain-containing protein [Caldimonas sp.]|jgi:predicted secreted hydrolase|nr:lipocalin-like domain-containing protein [Caldimonas sp.]HEX4233386.1 lipocalin-like domain-containing protein [Caldimonas sp.]
MLLASRSGTAIARDAPAPLGFPADFGAHPTARSEWWYVTGALDSGARTWGFQVTFFRVPTSLAGAETSRFKATQLLFAHAAVSDLARARLRHDQRIARAGFGIAEAGTADTAVVLEGWRLSREGGGGASRYVTHAASESAGFAVDLVLAATGPVLLQGDSGWSRKGPRPEQFSRYYSEPQLAARGTLAIDGRSFAVEGRAWLDHEWSDAYLDPMATGWDWIGMNLDDGGALMAFRIRRADGSTLWSGGSHRPRGGSVRSFATGEVVFTPGRTWTSAATHTRYPVEWQVATPVGGFGVRALLDDQELDSRASTGTIYWEGLSLLVDAGGRRVGRGYLEMTGYAARLVL